MSYRYGHQTALHALDLRLCRGEVLGLLGRNGAGKSTALHLISGVLAPSTGSVSIIGHSLLTDGRKARRNIGFLPETPPLYPELKVDEYLRFAGRLHGVSKAAIPKALAVCKQRCGLTGYGKRLLGLLSDGLKKRVGIAQAIIHEPALIILDEPTSNLDPVQAKALRALIHTLRERCGIVLSTHLQSEMQSLCDQILILHRGRTVLNQTTQSLQQELQKREYMEFSFHSPPEVTTLHGISGVVEVEQTGTYCFTVRYQAGSDATDAILAASLRGGWGLRRCTAQHETLESLFVRLTGDDCEARPSNEE